MSSQRKYNNEIYIGDSDEKKSMKIDESSANLSRSIYLCIMRHFQRPHHIERTR